MFVCNILIYIHTIAVRIIIFNCRSNFWEAIFKSVSELIVEIRKHMLDIVRDCVSSFFSLDTFL